MAPATAPAAIAEPVGSDHAASREPELYRMNLATFARLGELGAITRADRVVLLDGLLVLKMTKGPLHNLAVNAAMMTLLRQIPAGYHLKVEAPIDLPNGPTGDSSPEPDLAVLRGSRTDYRTRLPGAADVLLVVEVADSSLRLDRQALVRYAWAGIPTVWIINLKAGTVEVYTQPSGPDADPAYAAKTTRSLGESLSLTLDGGLVIDGLAVADLFE